MCASYVSVFLIVVDPPVWLTRLCRPKRLRFKFLMAVDIQLYRAGDIRLRQIRFFLLIAVDIPLWSTRLCRPERLQLKVYCY